MYNNSYGLSGPGANTLLINLHLLSRSPNNLVDYKARYYLRKKTLLKL